MLMLRRVTAVEFVRATTSGRTGPLITICEDRRGDQCEVVAKFTGGCEQGAIHLARASVGSSAKRCKTCRLSVRLSRPSTTIISACKRGILETFIDRGEPPFMQNRR